MAAISCIRVQRRDQTIVYRVEGRVTMTQCPVLRRNAEESLAGGIRELQIDLSGCTYFDSTFLGTLLLLHRNCTRRSGAALSLVQPSRECRRLLEELGVAELFPRATATEDSCSGHWDDLGQAPDPGAMKGNVVQAHVELASLPGLAGEAFRPVARCLSEAAKAEQKPAARAK